MAQVNQMRSVPIATPGKYQMICWAPVSEPTELTFSGTSYIDARRALSDAFGPFPIRLRPDHMTAITAMAAVAGPQVKIYGLIKQALEKHGNLELTDI